MKKFAALMAAVAVSFGSYVVAEELKSGLAPGASIGAFQVVKVAGAENDGIAAVGDQLCYRCQYKSRPQVMVFTRTTGEAVAKLTSELNAAVTKNADKELAVFVNVMNADKAAAEKGAKDLASHAKTDKVPVVVPVENENGPANYGVNPDAEVTVIVASKGKVVASQGFAAGKLDAAGIKTVLDSVDGAIK